MALRNIASHGKDVRTLIDRVSSLGFSLSDIARILGVTPSTIWRWYRGKREPKDPEAIIFALEKLLEANSWRFDVSYYSLSHNTAESHFAFKPVRLPFKPSSGVANIKRIVYGDRSRVLNEAKARLVAITGTLNITNKAFLDTCGQILEKLHSNGKLRYKRDVEGYVLAVIKLVSLMFKMKVNINPEDYAVSESEYLDKLSELIKQYHNQL